MNKKTNKSELIRNMVAKNPKAKATEIFALLKKDGVDASMPLIYQTLKRKPKTTVKRGRKPGAAKAKEVASSTTDLFTTMQSFVGAAGGLDKAIEILSVFKK